MPRRGVPRQRSLDAAGTPSGIATLGRGAGFQPALLSRQIFSS